MRPVLFHIGQFPVYSYSAFIVLGYVASVLYGMRAARLLGQEPADAVDVSIWIFITGLLGARLMYGLVEYRYFLDHPLDLLKIWNGGFVFYGGLLAAVGAALLFLRLRGLSLAVWPDLLAPVAMIALIFGRIGCYLNGCCYGRFAHHLPWGVVYPHSHNALGLAQMPVHPTPLYECLATTAIFAILYRRLPRKRFPGEVFWLMVLLYAGARFVVEIFRGDPRGALPGTGLSTSQALAVASGIAAVIFLVRGWRGPAMKAEAAP